MNQKLAVKILEKYGHTVEIAENGSLAVDAFKGRVAQGKPFDIILVGAVFLVWIELGLILWARARWMYRCRLWAVWRRPS